MSCAVRAYNAHTRTELAEASPREPAVRRLKDSESVVPIRRSCCAIGAPGNRSSTRDSHQPAGNAPRAARLCEAK